MATLWNDNGVFRLSVNRNLFGHDGDWEDGITWDELQQVKRECGFSKVCAIELFPPDHAIVNDANIRHLWFLKETPAFAWGPENRAKP